MDLNDAIKQLTSVHETQARSQWSLHVRVFAPGTIGGTPCEELTKFNVGFDWDNGKIIFDTQAPLTRLSPEDVAAIHKSAKDGQSWHAYQTHKKQADRIKALEAELVRLRGSQPSGV